MHIKFCDCLKQLLTDLGISSSRLAKAINVDSSLVNRWINGKRIPSYNTAYIENIADYLYKNIHNTFQEQQIQNLIKEVCGSDSPAEFFKDQIQYLLLESQGYSMKCLQKEKNKTKNQPSHTDYTADITGMANYISLSSNDKLLTDHTQIVETCLSMLTTALTVQAKSYNTIFITYNNTFFPAAWSFHDSKKLTDSLLHAIHKGWKLALLIQPNYDTDYSIRLIDLFRPLLITGHLTPYYMQQPNNSLTENGLFIVPDVGMLSGLSNDLFPPSHYAFYLTSQPILHICLSNLNLLLKEYANALLVKHYGKKNCYSQINRIEKTYGRRFLYRYYFGMMTFPQELYCRLLQKQHISEEEKQLSIDLYQKRYASFLSNIENYSYFDIYVSSCIDDLLEKHQISFYSCTGIQLVTLEIMDIIEHLQYIIYLLETYDNYHIAFYPSVSNKNTYCLVKERHSVLYEVIHPGGHSASLRIDSEDPMLTNGFFMYLSGIWDQIPPANKNKKDIIFWLDHTVSALRKELGK